MYYLVQLSRSIDTKPKTWYFFNGAIKASQGSPLHVADCTSVCNGEVGIGSGSGGVENDDSVIQSKVGYSKFVEKDLGKDKEKFQYIEEQTHNEELFVELECNQKFWLTRNKTNTWAFF